MRSLLLIAILLLGASLLGCNRAEETQAYSSEMSKEMPKPTSTTPDNPRPKGFIIGTGKGPSAKGGQ